MGIFWISSTIVNVISIRESNSTGFVDVTIGYIRFIIRIKDNLTTAVGSFIVGWPPFISSDSINGLKEKYYSAFVGQMNYWSHRRNLRQRWQRLILQKLSWFYWSRFSLIKSTDDLSNFESFLWVYRKRRGQTSWGIQERRFSMRIKISILVFSSTHST